MEADKRRFHIKIGVEPPKDFTAADFETDLEDRPALGLFIWALTHSIPMFSHVGPSFKDRPELVNWTLTNLNQKPRDAFAAPWSEVMRLALDKIDREWKEWLKLSISQRYASEKSLDNLLMQVLYPMIRSRDGDKCVICGTSGKLEIHHIMGKGRLSKRPPPFGRSVPTNLVTLCPSCHSSVDSYARSAQVGTTKS